MTPQRSPDNSGKKCFLTIFNFSGDQFLSSSCARRRSSCARRGSCTRRRSSSCARRKPYMSLLVLISAYWGLLLLIGAYYCLLGLIWPAYWCLLVLIWSAYGCLLLLISYEKNICDAKRTSHDWQYKKKMRQNEHGSSDELFGIRVHHPGYFVTPDFVVIAVFC